METTTTGSRTFEVNLIETPAVVAADLVKRGWIGQMYSLTGKRGARYIAYCTPSGQFEIVTSLR